MKQSPLPETPVIVPGEAMPSVTVVSGPPQQTIKPVDEAIDEKPDDDEEEEEKEEVNVPAAAKKEDSKKEDDEEEEDEDEDDDVIVQLPKTKKRPVHTAKKDE